MAQSGFTPISLYFSATGAAVPIAGNLVAGELALNTNDGKLYFKNSSGVVTLLAGSTSGPAGGSTTQVQYNNAGVLAGITGATTNGTALTLVAPVLGTPASGVVTNLTGTASININGTVGATTPATGAFTTLSSTGNTTLGNATTDTVTVNGYVAVGGAPVTSAYGLHVRSTALIGTQQYGIVSSPTITSAATSQGGGLYASVSTAADIFTVVSIWALRITDGSKGAGSTISNNSGIYITDLTNGTNNYGIVCDLSAGANKYNIYASGTAQNVFAGNVRIGSTVAPTVALDVTGAALISSTLGVTGVSTFAAGTVALPSITTSGDTNTGVYFPAADTVGVTTGGAQRGAFSSTGLAVTGYGSFTNAAAITTSTGEQSLLMGNQDAGGAAGPNFVSAANGTLYFGRGTAFTGTGGTHSYFGSWSTTGLAVTGTISTTGVATFPAGTVALPSITTTGDTNTGIYFPAADTVAASTAGTERLRIDSGGKVGIGLTSYSLPLSVVGDGNGQNIQLNGRTGDSLVQMFFRTFGGANNLASISSDSGSSLYFGTGSQTAPTVPTERMRIDASGNVGIGTASPNASAILDAQSTTKGVRMPNMTTTQKNAIATPAAGLMVYDTTLAKLCVYTTAWETITSL